MPQNDEIRAFKQTCLIRFVHITLEEFETCHCRVLYEVINHAGLTVPSSNVDCVSPLNRNRGY